MNPSKPEWYSMLKQEPFVIQTFDSTKSMKLIERGAMKEKRGYSINWNKIGLLTAVLLLASVSAPAWSFINNRNTSPESRLMIVRPEPILDEMNQILYIDPNWRISKELFDVYQSYASSPQGKVLAELPPVDIFKLLLLAVEFNNETLQKQLVVQDSTEMLPKEKVMTAWEKWKKNYYMTVVINEKSSYILLTPDTASSEAYRQGGERKIRFIKSESGIWQIDQKYITVLLNDVSE